MKLQAAKTTIMSMIFIVINISGLGLLRTQSLLMPADGEHGNCANHSHCYKYKSPGMSIHSVLTDINRR